MSSRATTDRAPFISLLTFKIPDTFIRNLPLADFLKENCRRNCFEIYTTLFLNKKEFEKLQGTGFQYYGNGVCFNAVFVYVYVYMYHLDKFTLGEGDIQELASL